MSTGYLSSCVKGWLLSKTDRVTIHQDFSVGSPKKKRKPLPTSNSRKKRSERILIFQKKKSHQLWSLPFECQEFCGQLPKFLGSFQLPKFSPPQISEKLPVKFWILVESVQGEIPNFFHGVYMPKVSLKKPCPSSNTNGSVTNGCISNSSCRSNTAIFRFDNSGQIIATSAEVTPNVRCWFGKGIPTKCPKF